MSENAERRQPPAAGETQGPDAAFEVPAAPDQRAALAAAAQQSADAKFHAIMGDEFSLQAATGGVRGMIEAIAPGLCFVVVYVAASSLKWAVLSSLAVAVVATVIRLIQRTPVTQALGGLIGVLIGVVWAWTTHKGQNYYAGAILLNVAYLVACLVSVIVRWPVVGIVVGAFTWRLGTWREDRALYARARLGTWLLIAMFAIRIAVKLPLYLGGRVGWLGTMHLVLGIPFYALTLWLVWLLLRGHIHSGPRPGTEGSDDGTSGPEPEAGSAGSAAPDAGRDLGGPDTER